jgi:hypothetical protein
VTEKVHISPCYSPPYNIHFFYLDSSTQDTKILLCPWHSWGRWMIPRLAQKPGPLIYDHLPNFPNCFPACFSAYKTQELPVTQLARHVDLFHLMITDNQRQETLSIPHGLAPPIKPTTHFSQANAP